LRAIGIAGWSGSGKTTLLKRLIPILTGRSLRIATVKHAHHEFDPDIPGKDSYEHRAAGASQVLISSARRWALIHELNGAPEPGLDDLLGKLSPADLVLVEGFKKAPIDKIEVHRPALGLPLLAADDPHVVAVASDAPIDGLRIPRLTLDEPAAVADFILAHMGIETGRGGTAAPLSDS
jgi:molybdopterin-guanine dinucleotide biosynthesis protein B